MPDFAYRALTATGASVAGKASGPSVEAARIELVRRGLLPLSLHAESARRVRVRRRDAEETIGHLAALLRAGLTLEHSLRITRDASDRPAVRDMLGRIREDLTEGRSLSEAMGGYPAAFSALTLGIVRAGEKAGQLEATFARLAEHLMRQRELRARLLSAMLYPALMAVVGLASVLFLTGFVLPRFADLLSGAGVALPLSTRLLLGAGHWTRILGPPALVVCLLGAAGLAAAMRTVAGRLAIHGALRRVPVLGSLRAQYASVHLGRSLSALLAQGVPATAALSGAREAVTDEVVRTLLLETEAEVRAGGQISQALSAGKILPRAFLEIVTVGERSGRLAELLDRAAETMERRLTLRLDRLTRLAEPVMIVLFGVAIGAVALGLLQAIYGIHGGAF